MRSTMQPFSSRRAAGFTLIEVLMGVLVLGLGLLGLAAVFPAVVVQQRQAGDAVEGENAANAAEATLRGTEVFHGVVTDAGPPVARYYGLASTLITSVGPGGNAIFSPDGEWSTQIPTDDLFTIDPATGAVTVTLAATIAGEPGLQRVLPVGLRVVPSLKRVDGTGDAAWREVNNRGDEPRFVWDAAFRRAKQTGPLGNPSTGDRLQVAVFVRRIDTGIRSAGDAQPLSRRLADQTSRVVPVAVDADEQPQNNGVGTYSLVQTATGDLVVGSPREMVIGAGVPEGVRGLVAQVGQKFVVGSRNAEPSVLEVRSVRRDIATGFFSVDLDKDLPRSASGNPDIEFLFTPQVPVAVRLFTLEGNLPR